VTLANSGAISSTSGGTGNAGTVQVGTGSLAMRNGGAVSASTVGSGAGGDVAVTVTGDASLAGSSTSILAISLGASNAGNVSVIADNLSIINKRNDFERCLRVRKSRKRCGQCG